MPQPRPLHTCRQLRSGRWRRRKRRSRPLCRIRAPGCWAPADKSPMTTYARSTPGSTPASDRRHPKGRTRRRRSFVRAPCSSPLAGAPPDAVQGRRLAGRPTELTCHVFAAGPTSSSTALQPGPANHRQDHRPRRRTPLRLTRDHFSQTSGPSTPSRSRAAILHLCLGDFAESHETCGFWRTDLYRGGTGRW